MVKFAILLHRKSCVSREEFLAEYTSLQAAPAAGAIAHVLHRPHATDALRAKALGKSPQETRCDGLSFQWHETTPAAKPTESPLESLSSCNSYRVDEVVHWDNLGERPAGQWTSGIKMIALVRRRKGLSAREFRGAYLEHARVAREHHPGVARYVQNFVGDPIDDAAPVIDAIAELHFKSVADLTQRFYRDETSPQAVGADVGRFLEPRNSWSLLAEERVLR